MIHLVQSQFIPLKKTTLASALLLLGNCFSASATTSPHFAELENLVRETKALSQLMSGTSIAVVANDKVIYQGNWGYANIDKEIPATSSTPYYIASVTKPFVALNALLDINNKKHSETIPLSDMFPSLDIEGIDERKVTISRLLTHTSGLDNSAMVLASAYTGVHSPSSLEEMLINHTTLSKTPLGEFDYTNIGYNIYSVFADKHFNAPWQTRLEQQVFAPLQLNQTSARMSDMSKADQPVAKPYSLMMAAPNQPLYLEKVDKTMHAAGGMVSSTNDLARFIIAQLNQGKVDGKQVFPATVIQQSQQKLANTSAKYNDFERDGYAWGWYTGEYKGERMLHHFGGYAGTHSHLSFIPEKGIGLVVLNNEDFLSSKLTSLIADYVYGMLLEDSETIKRVQSRFDKLNQQVASLDKMRSHHLKKVASRKLILSLPKNAYQGVYQHPTLGEIKVSLTADEQMELNFGQLTTVATGFDKADTLRVTFVPTSGETISFNTTNKVHSLRYDGFEFVKKT